jgi:hypothetical protein
MKVDQLIQLKERFFEEGANRVGGAMNPDTAPLAFTVIDGIINSFGNRQGV